MKKIPLALLLAVALVRAAEPPPLPPMPPEPPTPVIFYGVDFLVGTELPDGRIAFMVPPNSPQITVPMATNFVEMRFSTNLTNWSRAAYVQFLHKALVIDTTAVGVPMKFYTTKAAEVFTNLVLEAEGYTTATNAAIGNFDGSAYLSFTNGAYGRASYDFTIVKPGRYAGWARVKNDSPAQDSFYLQIEGVASEDGAGNDIFDTDFPEEEYSGAWVWRKLRGRGGVDEPWPPAPGIDQRIWNLSVGEHTLLLQGRESNVELDKIVLTQDLADQPPE